MTKTILFLHIPKAAGTTLHQIIERQYPSEQKHSFGADAHQSIADFLALPPEQQAAVRIIKGHMAYGLHQSLPHPSTYFTILRNPVERTISYYYYVLRTPAHYLHDQVVSQKIDLAGVLARKMTPDLDNGQVRLISGVWNEVPVGEMTSQHLEQALKNLKKDFQVVGLAEQFALSLMLLQKSFGWRHVYFTKSNVTKNRPQKKALPVKTIAQINQYNHLDVALYAAAQEIFAQQIAQQPMWFHLWYRLFMLLNGGYGRVYPLLSKLRR